MVKLEFKAIWWCVVELNNSPLGRRVTAGLPEPLAFTHHEKLRATRFTPVALEKKRIHRGVKVYSPCRYAWKSN